MRYRNNRKAFSMLELLFVIVIMGILAKFGVEFIAQAYNSFIFSKINNDLQSKSESAVEFITKRLEYRIKRSVISRNTSGGYPGVYNYLSDTTLSDNNATVLEWVAADNDGFRGTNKPLWSGVIDLNASNAIRLISSGTDLNATSSLINILSYGTATANDAAIYFLNSYLTTNPWGYGGFIGDQNQTLHPINFVAPAPTQIWPAASNFSGKEVFEYYKLAWTAYAVELADYNDTTHLGNLYFYYNYRPWQGDNYKDDGTRVLLAEKINTFRFRSAGSLIKIQVCAKSDLTGEEYALCKEKTVY
jgi:prepilin-type N-terminal cleavage/methylation domain-containing protein